MISEEPRDPSTDPAIPEAELWGHTQSAGTDASRDRKAVPWPRRIPAGPEPPPETNDDRMSLLCLLIHTARALAQSQISISNGFEQIFICASCGTRAPSWEELRHSLTCLSAEVTSIIDRLGRSFLQTPKREEELVSHAGNCYGAEREDKPTPRDSSFAEPWTFRAYEPGTFDLVDADGLTRAKVTGRYLECRDVAERIVTCVNFCTGNSTELLGKLKAAAEGRG